MFIVLLATVFGGLAAVMAYLISYGEYSHHFPDKRRARRIAFRTALVTFFFFAALGGILAIILPLLLG